MARHGIHFLTALQVQKLAKPGRHADGGGLYLVIDERANRKWVLRVQQDGRRRDFGLGSANHVGLAEARTKAQEMRRQLRDGLDPVQERKAARMQVPTFEAAAKAVHAENLPTWKNPKHAAQWLSSLETYAFPKLGRMTVDKIEGPDVREVLMDIWLTKAETARRVRQRIRTVLDYAYAKGYRPAPLSITAISKGLPRQPARDRHFEAMPWQDVPAFIADLRETDKAGEPARLMLEFIILTAARSGEARGALWSEIDSEEKLWRIDGSRMKAGRPHLVPLTERCIEILARMADCRRHAEQELIFEGARPGKPMSDMTLTMALRRMEIDATVHGFRSTFRDFAAEQTGFPREVAEQALAHTIESAVERAYRRGDLLEKRRKLMAAWEKHCLGTSAKVVAIHRGRTG